MPAAAHDDAPTAAGPEPDLGSLLKILGAAADLRRDREAVDHQLNLDEVKAGLRERLLAAAEAAGDPVRPAEVDAAIDQYYARLFDFHEPPLGPSLVMAHLYVRRRGLAIGLAVGLMGFLLAWSLVLRPLAPLSATGRARRAVLATTERVDRLAAEAATIADDPAATRRIEELDAEADALAGLGDAAGLGRVRGELERLKEALEAEYAVEVVREPGRKSGIDTYYTDEHGTRSAGYYLILEARWPGGGTLPRRVRNEESGATKTVMTWAERVPKAVYDRVAADKRADGRVDDYLYAVKRRGRLAEEVRMTGPDGRPLPRLGQITEW